MGEQGWKGGGYREQIGGCSSLRATEISTAAQTFARGSFKPSISMESGFLFNGVSGVPSIVLDVSSKLMAFC